jgi:hypothetical protein
MAEYVGDLVAVGEIQNTGSSNLGYVVVRGLAYNSTNDVVCSAESTAFVTDMTPGQKAPFYLDFAPENSVTQDQSWVPSVTNVSVDVVYANDTTDNLYSGLISAGVSAAVDSTGTYTVRGVVQNTGNQVAGPVNLITTFYNASGTVVAVNATYVADSIATGTVAQFVATPTDNTAQLTSSITNYSLLIQAPVLTTTATPTPTESQTTSTPTSSTSPTTSPPTKVSSGEIIDIAAAAIVIVVVVLVILMVLRRRKVAELPLPPPPPQD